MTPRNLSLSFLFPMRVDWSFKINRTRENSLQREKLFCGAPGIMITYAYLETNSMGINVHLILLLQGIPFLLLEFTAWYWFTTETENLKCWWKLYWRTSGRGIVWYCIVESIHDIRDVIFYWEDGVYLPSMLILNYN